MKMRNLAIVLFLILGLGLAGCTRSASTAPVPTNPPAQGTPNAGEDPTMVAVRLTAAVIATKSVGETQTAVAKGTSAGGEKPTAAPQDKTPGAKEVATAAPAEATAVPVAPTPVPVVPTVAPTAVACPNPYMVKQGDWIYKIARDCKLDPAAIVAANPGISPNFITPGQKLNLPGASAAAPAAVGCSGNYTVVRGDTLFNIAYRCGLTTEQLAAANGIRYPFLIHPGDVLKFP